MSGKQSQGSLLFVDDDPALLDAIKRNFRKEPYSLFTALTAEEALEVLEREEMDVVVSDENMPGMSGIEFLSTIKRKYPRVVRMMATGHVTHETAIRAINEGHVFRFLAKPFDMTDISISIRYAITHKRMEESLRESEERFRVLCEAAFEGIAIIENEKIADTNCQLAEMFGYGQQEIIGMDFASLTPAGNQEALNEFLSVKEADSLEAIGVRKDFSTFPFEARGRAMLVGKRQLKVIVLKDITKWKQTELELVTARNKAEDATRLKDEFVGIVSHNLKSPIISMMSSVQGALMNSEASIDQKSRERLSSVIQAAETAIGMVDKILDHNRLKNGKVELNPRFVDARKLGSIVEASLDGMAKGKGVVISNEIKPDTRIRVDPLLFTEALSNLVANAIKFSESGHSVTIFTPPGEKSTIAVKDTGVGIGANTLSHIFSRDVQTTTLGTRGERGTGLGLPLSLEIMKAHGGNLSVESKKGEGSVFYATLPHIKPSVLLVDFEDYELGFFQKIFLRLDMDMGGCVNQSEALMYVKELRPDLVIINVAQDENADLKALSEIKESSDTNGIVLMAFSLERQKGLREKVMKHGADDFIEGVGGPEKISQKILDLLVD